MVEEKKEEKFETQIFGLRTTANREDQVMDFVSSNADKKKHKVYSIIRAHGMRGYIFIEAESRQDAEQAAFNIPYARGILPKEIDYSEIEHMLETVKVEMNIKKNDIVEIISGPFKREQAKVTRIDRIKEEVVVELLEAAVPIPITVKMDAVKVIRRDSDGDEETEEETPVHIPSPSSEKKPIDFAGDKGGSLPMPGSETPNELIMPKAEKPKDLPMSSPKKENFKKKIEEVVEDVKEKIEDVVEDVKEKLHIEKSEEKNPKEAKKEEEPSKEAEEKSE